MISAPIALVAKLPERKSHTLGRVSVECLIRSPDPAASGCDVEITVALTAIWRNCKYKR